MAFAKVTKFVVSGLFVAMAACTNQSQDAQDFGASAGEASALAKDLRKHAWCTGTQPDSKGNVVVDRFFFRGRGELEVTSLQLQNDSTLVPKAQDMGNWGVIGDEIFMMREKLTMQMKIKPSLRATDQASCYDLTANGVTQQLCECRL